jgi:hypothetical protein
MRLLDALAETLLEQTAGPSTAKSPPSWPVKGEVEEWILPRRAHDRTVSGFDRNDGLDEDSWVSGEDDRRVKINGKHPQNRKMG